MDIEKERAWLKKMANHTESRLKLQEEIASYREFLHWQYLVFGECFPDDYTADSWRMWHEERTALVFGNMEEDLDLTE